MSLAVLQVCHLLCYRCVTCCVTGVSLAVLQVCHLLCYRCVTCCVTGVSLAVLQVCELVKSGELDHGVIQVLWEKFAQKIGHTSNVESRGALLLLGMAAT